MTVADALATSLQAVRGIFEMYGVNLTPVNMLEDEIARLAEDRDNWKASCARYLTARQAAEAEVARLRDGLRLLDRLAGEHSGVNEDAFEAITDITRPFLLAEDGAA